MVDSAQPQKTKYASLGNYSLIKTLGSGYNSKVKLGFDATSSKYYAVKIVKHSHPSLNMKILKKEIEMLTTLSHPNIVNLIEFQESIDYHKKNNKTYKAVAIVMELVPGGELFEYVADSGRFSEEIARKYFQTLIQTLEYCHNQGIAHRDLKPENLLFDESFNLKIADFGFATLLAGKDDSGLLHTVLGTESYMAPEIHGKKPYSGPAVDLFASAIILFILISGTPPFAKADPRSDPHYKLLCTPGKQEVFWKAHERNKPKKVGQETFYSAEFKDMINSMLAVEPSARLTLEQLKNHPWYNGPVLDSTTLREEFIRRKKLVDAELQQQREAKEKEKQRKNAHHAQGAFTGVKPFRSLLTGEQGEKINKELEAKVNFEAKRTIQDYQPVTGFKAATEVFSVLNTTELFRIVCELSKINLSDFNVSEDNYKIKGRIVTDEGTANLNILLTKVDDVTTCVEFHKTNGNVMTFYNTIEKIKKGIPHVEVEEEVIQEKTEAQ